MIKKGRSDNREYRILKLENELKCILVSDPDLEKSAACLQVNIGSLYDPPHVNGLAHFLEHMLFLGTKKYPEDNYYLKFIQNNGGQRNAATSEDYTYYYFDIKNEAFAEAVDIFSQFFKEPLFNSDATEREMNAVEQEFRKNLSEDSRRIYQLEKSEVCKKGSVLNRFSTGSLETLKQDGIVKDLLEFHDKYYSSNIMYLTMVGKQSLDDLEKITRDNFSQIINKHVELKDFSKEIVFDDQAYGHMVKIVPKKNIKYLKLQWDLPLSMHQWKEKSNQYICHILGHEGENSLLSLLIEEGLATGLMTTSSNRMRGIDQFHITVTLTNKGEEQVHRVIEYIFMFINKLQKEEPQEYIFKEGTDKELVDFEYVTKAGALSYANQLTGRMAIMDEQDFVDILWRPHAFEYFNKDEIIRRFNMLTPDKCIFYLVLPSNSNEENLLIEKWYGTQFKKDKIDQEFLQKLSKITPDDSMKLGFPPQNQFIPRNHKEMKRIRDTDESPSRPIKILDFPIVWFKQDDTFNQPFVTFNLKLECNDNSFPSTPLSQVFATLWHLCLNESQRELQYMAQLAGISFHITFTLEYITIQYAGYNDGITNFIQETMRKIVYYSISEEKFNDRKLTVIRACENKRKNQHYISLYDNFVDCMYTSYFKPQVLQNTLENELNFEMFNDLKSKWLRSIKQEWLIMGHLLQENAIALVIDVQQILKCENPCDIQEQNLLKLPQFYCADKEDICEDPTQPNSAVYVIFQDKFKNFKDSALLGLVFHLIKEPFFSQLRTKEQLGYIAQSLAFNLNRVMHGKFTIQSSVQGPDYLIHRINEFLITIKQEKFDNLSDEILETAKNALIKQLEQKELNLGQEGSIYWTEICNKEYEFDRRDKHKQVLLDIQKEEVVQYFNQLIFENVRRINLKIFSHNHWNNKEDREKYSQSNQEFYRSQQNIQIYEIIEDVSAFKDKHEYFGRL